MQFFPSDILNTAPELSTKQFGSTFNTLSQPAHASTGSSYGAASAFKDVLDNLSVYNEDNNVGAVPLTTASTRDKNSFFNSEDFKTLKKELTKLGVSEDVINQYLAYMGVTKNNPTIGDMRSAASELMEGTSFASLTRQESVQFSAMLSKMGFDNNEIQEIEDLVSKGRGLEVLKKLQDKIGAMTELEQGLNISSADFDILLKACNIQADMREPIIATLEGLNLVKDDMLGLNPESFTKLFSTTMAEMEKRELALQDLQNNIGKAIESMLAAKKIRPEEAVADIRGSALSARSETMSRVLATLINEEVDEEEENSTSHLIDNKNSGKAIKKESIVAAMADDKMSSKLAKEERSTDIRAGINGEEKTARMTAGSHLREESTGADNFADKRGGNLFSGGQQQNASDADPAKAALSSKVQEASGLVFSAFGQTENYSTSTNQGNQAAKTEVYNERIFDQIERGIVKNATDGSKQIVLRLDPPELGKLTLSLTVAQGEVKAVIRTESAATTQVVSEQLAQLKQSLEEQGFKVSSLEVETRAQSHAGTEHWSGTEQHNQEQQALEQARFLRLSRVRAKEGDTLAQSMQHMEHPASISASGLHIIA